LLQLCLRLKVEVSFGLVLLGGSLRLVIDLKGDESPLLTMLLPSCDADLISADEDVALEIRGFFILLVSFGEQNS